MIREGSTTSQCQNCTIGYAIAIREEACGIGKSIDRQT